MVEIIKKCIYVLFFGVLSIVFFVGCNKNEVFISNTKTECTEKKLSLLRSWENIKSELYYGANINIAAKIEP